MEVERVAIGSLHEDPANARRHGPRNLQAIKASLARWGQQKPIVVGAGDVVVAGNGTLRAALELGWSEIDVVRTDLEGPDRIAYALADNRTSELAEWEDEVLAATLQSLAEDPTFELDVTGFEDSEVEAILRDAGGGAEVSEVETPEAPEQPVTRAGDLWLLGPHRLLCGDSTRAEDVERVMAGETPFLMVTDPPYGVSYDPAWRNETALGWAPASTGKVQNDDRVDWSEAWSLFEGSVCYVWCASWHLPEVGISLSENGFDRRSLIVWKKPTFPMSRGHYHWQHEPCWYAVRKGETARWCGDRKQSTIWELSVGGGIGERDNTFHGTQKPVECMARPMRNHGAKGDVVYDPFLGSGTTLIAAEQLGRRCYGIEIAPAYVDVSVKRWQALTEQDATLETTGQTFSEVEAERCSTG